MTRVFKPADLGEEQAFLASHCNRCTGCFGRPCDILEAVRINDETDPDYPSEWRRDDTGRPTCTAFAPLGLTLPEGAPVAAPAPMAPQAATAGAIPPGVAAAADLDIDITAIFATSTGRGVIDAIRLRRNKRSWTVPYAQVAELFDGPDVATLRQQLDVPEPAQARVHRGKLHVTITARSSRDASSVSSSVRLKLAGRRG